MGYRLRVPAEIGDWLAGLRESEPPVAAEVAASLVALMDAADLGHLPLVALAHSGNAEPEPGNPLAATDAAYRGLREDLQKLRQQADAAATERQEAERRIGELQGRPGADPALLAAAVSDRERAAAAHARFAARSQSAQAVIDQYRTSKETAKAMFTAAQAAREVHESINAGSAPSEDRELTDLNLRADQAAAKLNALVIRARQLRHSIRYEEEDGDGGRGAARSARERPTPPGLLQLKADPLGNDIRIIFAEDPAGTTTLLTILEGPEAIADDWDEATAAAAMLLEVIRDNGWPPYADEPDGGGDEFADSVSFRQRFFPGQVDAVAARAVEIADSASLASLRERSALTVAELADKAGLTERRVAAIERGGLRYATLHELTAYLRAVGSTLDVRAAADSGQLRLI
jgi:phage shock protein A/DNA-binding XRE family transcriptional regulator